jgi:hypothetical protein
MAAQAQATNNGQKRETAGSGCCQKRSVCAGAHLAMHVHNWYNLVAALAAGGVPFCD